ncbi:MAG: CHAT domain-containing protein [Candidatus Solibacter usitatus]|nr:CHAT domain-containing protein [Candidatus Solibacter usitatus]
MRRLWRTLPAAILPFLVHAARAEAVDAARLAAEAGILEKRETGESLEEAARKYEQAAALWGRRHETRQEARALQRAGVVYGVLGENFRAREAGLAAVRLLRVLHDRKGEADALITLSAAIEQLGEKEEALRHLRRAVRLQRMAHNPAGEARARFHIGVIHDQRGVGHEPAALAQLERARDLFERAGDRRGQADAIARMGMTHDRLGDRLKAEECQQSAIQVYRQAGDSRGGARAHYNLGMIRFHAANYTKDDQLRLQFLDHAWESLGRVAALQREMRDRVGEARTLMLMGRVERGRGNIPSAVRYFEAAIGIVESTRELLPSGRLRVSFLATKESYYLQYISALMDLHRQQPGGGYDARALETSERRRARGLVERMYPVAQRESLGIGDLRAVLDNQTVLLEYSEGDSNVFLWVVTPETLHTFDLGSKQDIVVATERYLGLLLRSHREPALSESRQKAAAQLSALILGPAAALLASQRLALVLDSPLHQVPFAALPTPGKPGVPLGAEHELVRLPSVQALAAMRRDQAERNPARRTVAVLADPVFDRRDPRIAARNGRARGAPESGLPGTRGAEGRFARLVFSRREAGTIASLTAPSERAVALDFAASREAATRSDLREFRIVHYATHGLLDESQPEQSGLALSMVDERGQARDGFLRLQDIYRMKLPVDLVVLSACQTGLGKDVRGEGVLGLTRAFLAAGAKRVVASLWKVDDEATAEFMGHFYRAMLGPRRLTAPVALRSAQNTMQKDPRWRSPFYWSAFVLQGDWR